MSTGNSILYQFFCNDCFKPFEITMTLTDLDEYDMGKESIPCPECGHPLDKIICPPRRIRIN